MDSSSQESFKKTKMDRGNNCIQPPRGTPASELCPRGCNSYRTTLGFCVNCYQDWLRERIELAENKSSGASSSVSRTNIEAPCLDINRKRKRTTVADRDEAAAVDQSCTQPTTIDGVMIKKRYCGSCSKRLGFVEFPCKCGGIFCGAHWSPEAHACTLKMQQSPYSTCDVAAMRFPPRWISVIKKRCMSCSKKVGSIGFDCKGCNGFFCGAHRHPETHSCSIDFKAAGKLAIMKDNPVCKADKMKDRV